jgi:CheY-like chemotaxis protein
MEVARRFRALESRGKRARIIATTALSTVADREACLAAGMDAFLTKPITPQKLLGVLARSEGATAQTPEGEQALGRVPGLDLGMILHLADGSAGSLERELERYLVSLDEALACVCAAQAAGSRSAVASAAHRVLSLARMVGAASLSGAAADLQDYAAAFTNSELAGEIGTLGERVRALRDELESLAQGTSLSSSRGA